MTVTEKIGNEYMQWKPGDKIYISAPTGSGKTYFIFHKLLPSLRQETLRQKSKRILYLANRTVLKEQLERELSKIPSDDMCRVQIVLYQTIESYILYNRLEKLQKLANEYDYVICDECHYFLADSNYNTNTCLSFQWVQYCFSNKIRVFMSATMKEISEYIKKEDDTARFHRTNIYGLCSSYTNSQRLFKGKVWEYTLERHYDYLNVKIITTREQVIDLVCDGNEKWLIFVDSISFGQKQYKKIKKKLRKLYKSQEKTDGRSKDYKKDVVFLSSGYRREEGDPAEEVQAIKNSNAQSARILIATSVLDNGINLKDERLNNIIVLADNETELVQMLGRKREDGNRVNLYILKWEKEHFDRRLKQLIRKEQVALDYKNSLYSENISNNGISVQGMYLEESNKKEESFVKNQHILLLNRLLNEENMYMKIKSAFYAKDGILFLNLLSVYQMDHLKEFYNQMIDKFEEEGEDAFVREQLRWLGKKEDEIECIIRESMITAEERSRKEVCCLFEEVINKPLKEKEAVAFKGKVREYLLVLIQSCEKSKEKQTVENSLKKLDRPISTNNMDYLRQICKLPYIMLVKSNAGDEETYYTLKRADM